MKLSQIFQPLWLTTLCVVVFTRAMYGAETFTTESYIGGLGFDDRNAGAREPGVDTKQLHVEQRPAAADPEGNWGPLVEGVQVSLRFQKGTYEIGEKFFAVFIVRNTSTQVVSVHLSNDPFDDLSLIRFTVQRDQSLVQQAPRPKSDIPSGGPSVIGPKQQLRFLLRMDRQLDFSQPGEYAITASRKVRCSDEKGIIEPTSGTAILRIVEKAPTVSREAIPSPTNDPVLPVNSNLQVMPRTNSQASSPPHPSPPPSTETSQDKRRHLLGWAVGGLALSLVLIFYFLARKKSSR